MTIDFGTVLEAVNAGNLYCGINPIKDAIIAHAELAESGQVFRHTDEPTMNHASGIVREPLDFAFHAHADSGVQPGELGVGLAAYFDLLGHGWTRLVAGFPRLAFTGHVFAPLRAQFGDDVKILCREPVLKLVERFNGRENGIIGARPSRAQARIFSTTCPGTNAI